MSERKKNWYWVRLVGGGEWESSKLNYNGEPEIYSSDKTWDVGPRIPTPDEPWQTVPVEPTEEMERAGAYARSNDCFSTGIYADMLAAAPKPEDEV